MRTRRRQGRRPVLGLAVGWRSAFRDPVGWSALWFAEEGKKYDVEYTDEFEDWWNRLSEADQRAVNNAVNKLVLKGIALRGEHTKDVRSSRHGNMRELRVQTRPPIRVFYAFDPRRTAILLIGGHKTHPERFYRDYVPRADAIYDDYLREIRRELVRARGRDRTEGGGRSR